MGYINRVFTLNDTVIILGPKGSHGVLQIDIDLSEWTTDLGTDGTIVVSHQRSEDAMPYPMTDFSFGDSILSIFPNATDTGCEGYGQLEINFAPSDGGLQKSKVFKSFTPESMSAETSEPADYSTWYDATLALVVRAETAADNAEDSADDAQGYATQASGYATQASGYADSASGFADSASASATAASGYADTASDYADNAHDAQVAAETAQSAAEDAAEDAAQSAAQSGWAHFNVCQQDGHAYVTMTPNVAETVSFTINTSSGHMEVTYNG